MDGDQQIRAEALKAAASYSVHLTKLGEDRLFRMADTFAAYIEGNARLIAAAPMIDALLIITQLKNDPSLTDSERAEMAHKISIGALALSEPRMGQF